MPTRVEALHAELRELRASMLWAYSMGHGCSIGDHPRFRAVRERDRDLQAQIQEHEARG